jgi:nondiscriminating glutamyl-tRNA synthetase
MNGQYLMRMSAAEISAHLAPFLPDGAPPVAELQPAIDLNKARARTLKELAGLLETYLAPDEAIVYDDEAVKKHLRGEDLVQRMTELHDAFSRTEPFDVSTSEQALRALAESRGLGAGKYIHPLRVALTGKTASPPIFDVAVTLGKERSLRRLQRLIEKLPGLS